MITLIKYGAVGGGEKYNANIMYIDGLSGDTKPTGTFEGTPIPNASVYTEIDTGKEYTYDSVGAQWYETTTSGGGGGGGGTTNYAALSNKPQINGTTLSGNKTSADLGLQGTLTQTQLGAVNSGVTANSMNVLEDILDSGEKNIIFNGCQSYTSGSFTCTVNANGSITLNGTVPNTMSFLFTNLFTGAKTIDGAYDNVLHFPQGNYRIATSSREADVYLQIIAYNTSSSVSALALTDVGDGSKSFTVNNTYAYNFARIRIIAGKSFSNFTFMPFVCTEDAWLVSKTVTPYRMTTDEITSALNGKQNTIDSSHKLSADNVDDTNTTNKFATAAELTQIETNKNNILKVQTEADLNESALLGTNIFDKSTFIYDAERSSTTGEVIPNTAKYGVSALMPVRSGKTICFSKNGSALAPAFIYTWNKEGTFIGRSSGSTTYSVPSNVGYISICIYYNDGRLNTYQAEYDKVSSYQEYGRIYSNDIKQTAETFMLLASVNMFGTIAGIGDSYTAGFTANSIGTSQTMTEQSYIATIGKRSGVDWYNYGVTGATAKTYITNANGLPKVLAADAHDLYIVNLGQNDINVGSTVGTISDIHLADYTQNPDTYYGNMGSILSQLKAYAPNAKIILVKSWLNHNKSGTDISYQSLDAAIAEIAALYNIPCIAPFDDVFFNSTNYQNYRVSGHPTTMGYAMMGLAMERLLSKCIVANPSYFQFSTIG